MLVKHQFTISNALKCVCLFLKTTKHFPPNKVFQAFINPSNFQENWSKIMIFPLQSSVYDFFGTSPLNTCQKFARLWAWAKLWHLLGHSGKLLTIEVIFSASRPPPTPPLKPQKRFLSKWIELLTRLWRAETWQATGSWCCFTKWHLTFVS